MEMSEDELRQAVMDLGDGHHSITEIENQVEKNRHKDKRKATKKRKTRGTQ